MKSVITSSLSILLIAATASAQNGTFVSTGVGCPNAGTDPSTDILAADDTVNGPHDLGWTFNYAGGAGSTTMIDIAPNGYIYLEAGTNTASRCCNGSNAGVAIADFFSATPSIACFGQDLNATAAGSIHFETNGVDEATITWDHVAEFGTANAGLENTIVCTLRGDGSISIAWGNCSLGTHEGLVGYSPGGGAVDNGSQDFAIVGLPITGVAGDAIYETFGSGTFDLSGTSVLMIPTAGSYTIVPAGPAGPFDPLEISSADMPNLNSTFNIDITGIPAGALWSGVFFGTAAIGPVPLPNAPGCFVGHNLSLGGFGGLGVTSFALLFPNNPALKGQMFYAQGAALVPAINPLQIVSSNVGVITVGEQVVCVTTEDFEGTTNGVGNYPTGWSDGGGTAQWSSNSGGTTSGATGPTAAVSGTQYMYCETSGTGGTSTFNMNTRVYTAAEMPTGAIAFQLSRVGASIGSLDVLMDDGINPPVLLANFTGAAGDWSEVFLTLPSIPAGGASFQFNYTAGGTFTGDIAIDDFCTL